MSIMKWNPFAEMESLHNEMNRLFSRVNQFGGYNSGDGSGTQSWLLPVDVLETQDTLKLRTALPGVDPKDVNIEVKDNVLTISAERRFEDTVEEGGYHWVEQQYGTLNRSIALPKSADAERIEARYHNGVLELVVPKKESAKPRRIELQSADSPKAFEQGTEAQPAEAHAEPATTNAS